MSAKISKFDYLFSLVIILLPFLYQYASPLSFLSLGDFVLCLFTFILIIIDGINGKKNPLYLFFFWLILLILFLNMLCFIFAINSYYSIESSLTIILKIFFYSFVIIEAYIHFHYEKIEKIYYILTLIFTIYLFIQFIYHKMSGGFLPIFLKYEWLFSWEKIRVFEDLSYYYNYVYYQFRPSSLFMEPGYYALYVLPAIYINLLKKEKMGIPLVLTIGNIISTSGAGLLLSGVAWSLWIIRKCFIYKDNCLYVKTIPIFISFVFLLIVILVSAELNLFPKLFNSLNTRFTRGFIVFNNYQPINRIFGVGINNVEAYMKYYHFSTIYDESNLNFGSTFTKIFMEFGILGFLLSLIGLMYILKKCKMTYLNISLILLFLLYCIFEDMLFNFRMGFYITIIMYYAKNSEINDIIKVRKLRYI